MLNLIAIGQDLLPQERMTDALYELWTRTNENISCECKGNLLRGYGRY